MACARTLAAAGLAPVVLDKGRGVGGSVATRRVGALQFDHGAHYVTAQNHSFSVLASAVYTGGGLVKWPDKGDRSRYVGQKGMSALAKALGVGLDIYLRKRPVLFGTGTLGVQLIVDSEAMAALCNTKS